MQFQIQKVILWPKDSDLEPRIVEFESGQVNVITGASQTGKSAMVPIIDYCLGSDKCAIPAHTIRSPTAWFGVVVDTAEGPKLFARREPGTQRSTSAMFVDENGVIPSDTPAQNANLDSVKRRLDELAGLSNLDFDAEETGAGFQYRPSFRDMHAFTIQPQHVVANPYVLFYKADSYEHREKLRTVFPVALNAIDGSLLAKRHLLAQLRKELRRKQNELKTASGVSQRWLADIRARAVEARELGLLQAAVPESADITTLIGLLDQAVRVSLVDATVTAESIGDALAELQMLRREESEASDRLSHARSRFDQMNQLRSATSDYQGALAVQRDRLAIAQWMRESTESTVECPVCGSNIDSDDHIAPLIEAIEQVEQEAGSLDAVPAAFDREFDLVQNDVNLQSERLRTIRFRIRELERTSDAARQRQFDSAHLATFIGATTQALSLYRALGQDSDLSEEVRQLQERVDELAAEIADANVTTRIQRALQIVNANAARILPNLDVEFPNDPVELLIDDLTIRVISSERTDYLWELGSGANWLSYHVAISLALQQFFLSQPTSPVPSFLIFDQPSQVYFPTKAALRPGEEDDPQLNDEDIDSVRSVFAAFSAAVTASKGRLQIIVLDHAGQDIWNDLPNTRLVEEWRQGRKLVPSEWLT